MTGVKLTKPLPTTTSDGAGSNFFPIQISSNRSNILKFKYVLHIKSYKKTCCHTQIIKFQVRTQVGGTGGGGGQVPPPKLGGLSFLYAIFLPFSYRTTKSVKQVNASKII